MVIMLKESNPVRSIKVSKDGNSGTVGVGERVGFWLLLGLAVGF